MRVVSACVVTAIAVGGCAESEGQQTTVDCSMQVRADGIVYTSHAYTERPARKYSVAKEADCQDVGPEPAGSVLPETPRRVVTWTFSGYPPEKVLGVRDGTGSFAVFVADSVASSERERILDVLAKGTR